jgi:hypothetical protein
MGVFRGAVFLDCVSLRWQICNVNPAAAKAVARQALLLDRGDLTSVHNGCRFFQMSLVPTLNSPAHKLGDEKSADVTILNSEQRCAIAR